MRHSFVPVLLLAAVALSASNVLPMLPTLQQETGTLGIDGQQNDNIFSNKLNTRDILNNIFYKVPIGTFQVEKLPKKLTKYVNTNNNRGEEFDGVVNKADNYDDEGFRKKQWHNYPRQLDRLHEYLKHHYTDPRQSAASVDPDNTNYDAPITADRNIDDVTTNDFLLTSNDGVHNIYDAVVTATNPLLILKIHLACLSDRIKDSESSKYRNFQSFLTEPKNDFEDEEEKLFTNENPAVKVKREGTRDQEIETDDNSTVKKKAMSKRLFSLWSRLQSLSHKGHDLPHRRHIHSFYGFPDAEGGGGGVLTAETRATLMRPPGSPLRWG